MVEVNIEQQYRAMRDLVFSIAASFEDPKKPELVKAFPAFIVGSCYNMLTENTELSSPRKAVLLDHLIKLSKIDFEFSGFEIVLALESKREMGYLYQLLSTFRGAAENFWRTLWAYSKESDQKEEFKNFLLMFKIYLEAAIYDLCNLHPTLKLSAATYYRGLEVYIANLIAESYYFD